MKIFQRLSVLFAVALAVMANPGAVRSQAGGALPVEQCPETAPPTDFSGQALDLLTELKDGVVFDDTGSVELLRLKKEGGEFKSTPLGLADTSVYAAVADFDGDGWDDFVGAGEGTQFVRIYRNFSFHNLPVNWNDPNAILTPKFQSVRELNPNYSGNRRHPMAAADFNGDGKPDVFWASGYPDSDPYEAYLWLNNGNDFAGNPTFLSRYNAMASGTSPADLGVQTWSGSSVTAVDYNGDRKIDLLVSSGETSGGAIRIFLNDCTLQNPLPNPPPPPGKPLPCATNPRFTYNGYLKRDLGIGSGSGSLPVFAYADFDQDGNRDLVVGSPDCCSSGGRLRYFAGQPGGGLDTTYSSIPWVGAATTVLAADFSLDGKLDLLAGADNWNYGSNLGGISTYYKNDGDDQPFTSATQNLTTYNNPTYDFDVGFVFNYDNDPDSTPDVMIADGNHTASFYVFANRTVTEYVSCGDVNSGVLDLGALADDEMVVTAARLSTNYSLNGGSISFFMSNEEPPNWQPAVDCGDGSGDVCTTFTKPVGREVRWKATMCANAFKTQTPTLIDIDMTFDYTKAVEHYRAGVVVNDGVAYVGAFRQPGDRGHFYALNAGLSQIYWDAADKLDAQTDGSRNIYTTASNGKTRIDFHTSSASDTDLQGVMQTADSTQTADVINWTRSARFGIGNTGIAPSKLGAIETSTPGVVTRPGLPLWYAFAATNEKTKVDDFIAAEATRPTFVLFGSKDGMIHAVRNNPTNITDSANGTEAWAFIPSTVASGLLADYSTSLSGSLTTNHYPDGAPTVVDVKLSDNEYHTVAIVGGGNGNKSFVGLDVGDSVGSGGVVAGPDPLWSKTPGGNNAGQSFSKAAVARVKLGTDDVFLAIVGTGVDFGDPTAPYNKGLIVHAYDIATGVRKWKFKTLCPITSDIIAVETDDDAEANDPELDGYTDRVLFSDACGYVYKIDPARDLSGDWNDNANMGSIPTVNQGGTQMYALFSTRLTSGALGSDSPIAGTIAARPDSSTRLMLFFGTGGVESWDASKTNNFYAVYADTGEIRSKYTSACAGGRCEKFYGGAVVTTEQVIFTSTIDPAVGTGVCDRGTSAVRGFRLNADPSGNFVTDFANPISSAVMGAMYGDAGAIYFATLSGDVVRVGTPRSPTAGGDTASGSGGGMGSGDGGSVLVGDAMSLMGWRQVF